MDTQITDELNIFIHTIQNGNQVLQSVFVIFKFFTS